MNDWNLIREYVEQGSEKAFATLVRQYVDLVHAAAIRQVREPHLAEDATQAVFVVLARKASRLNSDVILPAWLHRTACQVARQVQRNETRRILREQEALPMNPDPDPTAEAWSVLGPQVDRALNELRAADREAVALRYLQRCTFREVGQRLGITEEAAKKRVSRALDLLRLRLRRLGITVTAGAMGAALEAHGSGPAPASTLSLALQSSQTAGAIANPAVAALVQNVLRDATRIRVGGIAAIALVGMLLVIPTALWMGRALDPVADGPLAAAAPFPRQDLPPAGSVVPPDPDAARRMTLRYLATDSDEPLAGVTVRSTFYGRPHLQSEAVTDADGEVVITRPDRRFEGMNVIGFLPAHTPLLKVWQRGEEPSLPRQYTLHLRPGMMVAGRVVDSEGRPIAGAQLQFDGGGTQWDTHEQVTYNGPVPRPVTDAQGRWSADFLDPAAPLIHGRIEHDDYAPTLFGAGKVAAGTNLLFVLERGVAVRGVVRDASGLAVPRAEIRLQDAAGGLRSHATTTDAAGSYQFPRVAAGNYRREVKAAGHQPLRGDLDVGPTALQEDLVLQQVPGLGTSLMRGRLMSRTHEWLGHAAVTLMPGQPGLEEANWTLPVPEDGHWEWRTAPDRPVKLIFSAWRHQDRMVEFSPGDAEVEVVLDFTPDILVHGTVRSEETGEPVPRFRVIRASNPSANEYIGDPELLAEGFDGRFAFRVTPGDLEPAWRLPGHPMGRVSARVMIQAEGMLQQIFPLPSATNGEVMVNLRLLSDTPTEGTVLLPNHRPADGAEVTYRGPQLGMGLEKPIAFGSRYTDERQPGQAKAVAGADGTFRLRPVDGATRLAVVHREGWANVPLAGLPREPVWLEPWGRIEGVVAIGGRVWPGVEVHLGPASYEPDQFLLGFDTVADAEGRFAFPQVPGGRLRLSIMRYGDRMGVPSNPTDVTVRAGETSTVTLGGSGVRVTGRLVPEPADVAVGWTRSPLQLAPLARENTGFSPSMGYGLFCAEDGTFAFEDVAPGNYRLLMELRSPTRDGGSGPVDAGMMEEVLGQLQRDVSVGDSAEPLDLGVLEIRTTAPR